MLGSIKSWEKQGRSLPCSPQREQSPADPLILNFSRPELRENIFLLVLSLWDSVTAAPGNEYSLWNQLRANPGSFWNRPARPTQHNTRPSVAAPRIRTEERRQSSAVCGFGSIVGGPRNLYGQQHRSQRISLGCESQEHLREMPSLLPGLHQILQLRTQMIPVSSGVFYQLQEKME